jgi:hypothetical protein
VIAPIRSRSYPVLVLAWFETAFCRQDIDGRRQDPVDVVEPSEFQIVRGRGGAVLSSWLQPGWRREVVDEAE